MVDNLAEKIAECPLNQGSSCIVCVQLEVWKVSFIQSSGVFTIQGFLMYWETIGTFSIILWASAVKGCQLSRVPLYTYSREGYGLKCVAHTINLPLMPSGMLWCTIMYPSYLLLLHANNSKVITPVRPSSGARPFCSTALIAFSMQFCILVLCSIYVS